MQVKCPHCGALLNAPASAVGRRVKCPSCQTGFSLTEEMFASTPVEGQTTESVTPAPETANTAADNVSFNFTSAESQPIVTRRRKRRGSGGPLLVGILLLAVIGGGAAAWYVQQSPAANTGPQILELERRVIQELKPFRMRVNVSGAGDAPHFALEQSPEGLELNSQTGELEWTPNEAQGPGEYEVVVVARLAAGGEVHTRVLLPLTVEEVASLPQFEALDLVTTYPEESVTLQVKAADPDLPASEIVYSLAETPEHLHASIHAETGELTLTPGTDLADSELVLMVRATKRNDESLAETLAVRIQVLALEQPIDRLVERLDASGYLPESADIAELTFEGQPYVLLLGDERMFAYAYPSEQAAKEAAKAFAEQTLQQEEIAAVFAATTRFYQHEEFLLVYAGESSELITRLDRALGSPFQLAEYQAPPPIEERDALTELLVSLYQERDPKTKAPKLFSPNQFAPLRQGFAERFEQAHEPALRSAFGEDYDDMLAWLNERPQFKETLFLAFHPRHDDITAGLRLIKDLKEAYPQRIDDYGNLAIATAVVWDRPRNVYDYGNHQKRVGGIMPENRLEGLQNFAYLVETEKLMQGRIRYVPWEFLVHVVNHRTPAQERQWALSTMLPRRVMFGKCYSDVPYDTQMLETSSRVCRLGGKPYSLPNLLAFGGVCAMQADYAARVGKSLGVPSEYVGGAASSGDLHAWVMWVELTSVTPNSVSFSLESHGRYSGDNYYVGTLKDPQTGRTITDRDLERRLHAVGMNTTGKRHAELLMQGYPELAAALRFQTDDRLSYLSRVIRLAPWNESAWKEVAQLAEEKSTDKKSRAEMVSIMNLLFKTFALLPDYTLEVFPDFVKFEPDLEERAKYYYRLLDVYSSAKRPDLAFRGLYKLSDLLVELERKPEALRALSAAAKKYANEGQYVPRMLKRIEDLCETQESQGALVKFYTEFLPLIPEKRGGRVSKYCMEMYERGIRIFQQNGANTHALLYQQKLAAMKTQTPK